MRKLIVLGGSLAALAVGGWTIAQEALPGAGPASAPQSGPPGADAAAKYSYSIGHEVGDAFHRDGATLDFESLLAGVKDGLSGAEPKFDRQDMDKALEELGMFRMQVHVTRNREYLQKSRMSEGVQVLPSGLQYKVLASGDGPTPGPNDRVKAHYKGQLIDGTVFDSSYDRGEPLVIQVGEVIPGWSEALQKMKVGDKWQLVIPSELGYGEQGFANVIPPQSTLVFEVELLGIE